MTGGGLREEDWRKSPKLGAGRYVVIKLMNTASIDQFAKFELTGDVELNTIIVDDTGHDYFFTSRHVAILNDVFQARERLLSLLRLTNSIIANFISSNALLYPERFSLVHTNWSEAPTLLSLDASDMGSDEYFNPFSESALFSNFKTARPLTWALGVALRDPNARMVLRYLSNSPNWDDMYRVYEIILQHQGEEFVDLFFPESQKFKRSANDPTAGGEIARHSRPIGENLRVKTLRKPASSSMTMEVAIRGIRQLVWQWFKKIAKELEVDVT